MHVICPTITAFTLKEYDDQVKNIADFAHRIHIDFMDGQFAPTKSPNVDDAWWPKKVQADLHIMHQNPMLVLDDVLKLHPHLVIVHEEARHVSSFVHQLHEERVKVGIALLPDTPVEKLNHFINVINHVLIFAGNLGHHGGTANLELVYKVQQIRELRPDIEIGWDGGINEQNIMLLKEAGVNVFNVGSAVQHAEHPQSAYNKLFELVQS